jgi:hypothetical protein
LQRQAGDSLDDDSVPRVGPFRAVGPPPLSSNPHLALRTAFGYGYAFGADERLRPDRRLSSARDSDPEGGLTELDRHPDDDRHDAPGRRQDEDSQEDGEDERQGPGLVGDDQDWGPDSDAVEEPGRVRDEHPDAAVRS